MEMYIMYIMFDDVGNSNDIHSDRPRSIFPIRD